MKTHVFKDEYNILDLFSDPRLWALDYRTRWEMSRRMKQIANLGRVEIPGVCDRTQFMQDMWTVWFLVTENDGRNLPFLLEQCNLRAALTTYYRDTLLKESLQPGYPTEDGEKALVAWTCIFAGIDTVGEDTPEEVDEKIFMLRPYVFACAKVGSSNTRPPKNLCLCSTTEQNPDSTTCRSPLGISKNSPSAILAALPTTLTLLSVTEL